MPFGYMARWGRLIEFQGTLSEAEHGEMVEEFIGRADEVRARQEDRRLQLMELLRGTDAVDLIAQLSLTYLHIDPDTFKEWEDDRSPAHVEYLALQVLGEGLLAKEEVDPTRQAQLAGDAVELVRELFDDAKLLVIMEAVSARREHPADTPAIQYRMKTRLESLSVRGAAYSEHLIAVLHGCFDPLDEECRRTIGFTASEAIALTHEIGELISDRIDPLFEEARAGHTEMLRQLKHEKRHRSDPSRTLPDVILDLPPSEAKRRISNLVFAWIFRDSRSLVAFSATELAERCNTTPAAAAAFLDSMACPIGEFKAEFHALPGGGHPLTSRPVLKLEEGYFVPVMSTLLEVIRPRMEDLLSGTPLWERYADVRGEFVEKEATARIESALPGSWSATSLGWNSEDAESDLDGLVAVDDVAFRLQCKAGRLSTPARRGAPERMRRDLSELIGDAADQHQRLADALAATNATELGFSVEQAQALARPLQLEVIVTLDDVTVWATETHTLQEAGNLAAQRAVPWVLSLTDLMAVTDILQGAQLVHYVIRRLRVESIGRVSAHDELDWVGYYTAEGLYLDDWFEGGDAPHRFQLLSYTEPIDAWYFTREGLRSVPAPKPAQPLPEHLQRLSQ